MEETDLIFLGAQSLLANGSVEMAKGGGIVALVGAEEQKPVLVCCETYKFNDRAAINALDNKNELGCSSDVDSRFVFYMVVVALCRKETDPTQVSKIKWIQA